MIGETARGGHEGKTMGIDFDWQDGELEEMPALPPETEAAAEHAGVWPLMAALVVLAVLGAWFLGQRQGQAAEQALRDQVAALLALEHKAVTQGDGHLFLTLLEDDPAWVAAQFTPQNLAFLRARRQVTRAEQHGDEIWVNVTWQEGEESRQRLLFFRWQGEGLRRVADAPGHWIDGTRQQQTSWGTLLLPATDFKWAPAIDAFVSGLVEAHCDQACRAAYLPLSVIITTREEPVLRPHEVRLLSPRLVALDEMGEPAAPFWQQLERLVSGQLRPPTIRFAVPGGADGNFLPYYRELAGRFMAEQAAAGAQVELVFQAGLAGEASAWLPQVDAAALPVTEALLTAGAIRDLTAYAWQDPQFDRGDFYEQVWQGALWRDRLWLVPASAGMNLLFYDLGTYRQAGLPDLRPNWSWDRLAEAIARLDYTKPQEKPRWALVDAGTDALFAYAFTYHSACHTGPCLPPLTVESVTAALAWYDGLARQQKMPDLTTLSPEERALAGLRLLSASRQASIWVDFPSDYEYQYVIQPVGVLPFPASDSPAPDATAALPPPAGISPLHVEGYVMSQGTAIPYWTWQWLKFLSYEPPPPRLRRIPARPSVARQSGYWATLPPPLAEAMKKAFPLGRAIRIGEETTFSWEQLAAIVAGRLSPQQAGQSLPPRRWFGER